MKAIHTDKAPAAIGPYVQGNIVNGLLFASGQIPLNPKTGEVEGTTITDQAEQVMKNIGELLKSIDATYANVVKSTCFFANMSDFVAFNEVYAKYFTENLPARSCVEVGRLPKDVLIEVEIIAEVPKT